MKIFFFLLLTLSLNADYLHITDNHCVTDLQPYQNNTGLCWNENNQTFCSTSASYFDFIDGYFYDGTSCQYSNDLSVTGLTQSEWDYQLVLLANLIGFVIFMVLSNLAVLIARK